MNGRVAKRLRRQVYGDQSLRVPRDYDSEWHRVTVMVNGLPEAQWRVTIKNKSDSLRYRYQQSKKTAQRR